MDQDEVRKPANFTVHLSKPQVEANSGSPRDLGSSGVNSRHERWYFTPGTVNRRPVSNYSDLHCRLHNRVGKTVFAIVYSVRELSDPDRSATN